MDTSAGPGRAPDLPVYRPLRADDVPGGGPAGGHGPPAVFSVLPGGCRPGAGAGSSAGTGRSLRDGGLPVRARTTSVTWRVRAGSSTGRPWSSGSPVTGSSGDIWGYPEGEAYFPGCARSCGSRIKTSPRSAVRAGDGRSCRCSTMTAAIAAAASPDGPRHRRPSLARDGCPAHPRGAAAVAALPGRVRRRFRGHVRPGGGDGATACGPSGPRPMRSPCSTTGRSGTPSRPRWLAGAGHDAARGHVRRQEATIHAAVDLAGDRASGPSGVWDSGDLRWPRHGGVRELLDSLRQCAHQDRRDLGPGRGFSVRRAPVRPCQCAVG